MYRNGFGGHCEIDRLRSGDVSQTRVNRRVKGEPAVLTEIKMSDVKTMMRTSRFENHKETLSERISDLAGSGRAIKESYTFARTNVRRVIGVTDID